MNNPTTRLIISGLALALVGFVSPALDDEAASAAPATKATPFLMFQGGVAAEAMSFYVELFEDGRIVADERYGKDNPMGKEGTILRGSFQVGGQTVRCTDSAIKHDFDHTASFSMFVDCKDLDELKRLAEALGEDGMVYMPIGDYGFSKQFTWVEDRFGISWQLSLPFDDDPEW